ncbi:MAG: hypothetical protein COA32_02560 [Fluviicola sp.]|nr:MAG: hypothetical protein COA32_02560 [Fluviicola sp.]
MEKKAFIEALTALTEQEDVINAGREVNELRSQFEDYLLEETRKYQVAQLEAQEKEEAFEEEDWMTPLKEEFYTIYIPFKEKRKALIETKKEAENENLKKKKALISKLKTVIAEEENIGAAFSAHKDINAEWKEIGDIPRDKRHDIQQEYSRLLEEFFYNMNIYKEIKDYDFKKNYDAKKSVVESLKDLLAIENIKEVESTLKQLQNEWEDIGPTKKELWEELKEEYWTSVKSLYDRIRKHYDERREQMKENIALKKAIIEKAQELVAKSRESVKDWNSHTKEILELQKEWKTIGFGPKSENKAVWKEFRGICDQFFEEKSEFFKEAQSEFNEVAEKKQALIDQVEQLKTDTNWGGTTKKIIDIQKRWKRMGNAGQKNEQRLWKTFRAACDFFFEAKKKHYESLEKEFEENLEKKKELIKSIEAYKLPDDKKEAIEGLNNFSKSFAEIGFVPAKQKDEIYKAYKSALDKHYGNLDIKGEEKTKVMFEARLNTIKGSGNSAALFAKEKEAIRSDIEKIKQEIIQFENNLGFFANSKGANALKDQVEANIAKEKKKIEALKTKLKMIPNE